MKSVPPTGRRQSPVRRGPRLRVSASLKIWLSECWDADLRGFCTGGVARNITSEPAFLLS